MRVRFPDILDSAEVSLETGGMSSRSAWCVFQRLPHPAFLAAGDALRDEVHTVHAVRDIGIERVLPVEFRAGSPLDHVVVCSSINVREGFQVALRMP
jgi:hypothetical protein